ncbi:hypothetical protein BD769DRAFT_1639528 [Suillus cothurnatus]|nr:hypothetical protein BD769DRAFT_1639528 [Suillus cothurnatus]
MSSVLNFLQAGRDVPEDIHSVHVPDLERAQHVRLALQSLDPPRDSKESQSLTPCSSFSSKKIIRHKKKYRPPALILDPHHPALQCPESFLDATVTERGSRHTKSQRSLPNIQTVPLLVPAHSYHSSITFSFPNSSPTSTVDLSPTSTSSTQNFLSVPFTHSPSSPSTPLSPLTPPPPSPSIMKQKRFSRLCRKFGESPPPELVFGGLPVPVGKDPRKACVQNAARFAPIIEESKESPILSNGLDASSTSSLGTSSSEDFHQPSSVDAETRHHISRQYGTACVLEKNGRRTTQRNYDDILKRLRKL